MLRISPVLLGETVRIRTTAFGLFLRRTKDHPALKGLNFKQRNIAVMKMWAQVTKKQREALARSAKRYGLLVERPDPKPTMRGKSPYHAFVKANIGKFKGMGGKSQMKLVAKLWREAKAKK